MGRGSSLQKLERLDQLLGNLKSGEAQTAGKLAEELGVSLRTLMRDLDTLRDRGYPIESDQGRGGGVRLIPRWGIGRLALNYREVIDLLLALSILEKLKSPLFLGSLKSVRAKLQASFPDSQKLQISTLRKRILVGELASAHVIDNYTEIPKNSNTNQALESFVEQKQLRLHYQREDGTKSERCVEIHYLFLNWPVWYLICYDHLRASKRVFRIDRVLKAEKTESHFTPQPLRTFSCELERFGDQL